MGLAAPTHNRRLHKEKSSGTSVKQFSYKNDGACRDGSAKKYRNKEASMQQSGG